MSAANRYRLLLYFPNTTLYGEIPVWSTLSVHRVVGNVGLTTVTLPGNLYPVSFWQRDMQLAIIRSVEGNSGYLEGQTRWFLRKWTDRKTKQNHVMTLMFMDANCLLTRRGVGYAANSDQSNKTGPIDNLMKAIFRENFGAFAGDERDLSAWIGCETDMGLLPSCTQSFAWRNVHRVINDLSAMSAAAGVWGCGDVIWNDGVGFEFRTYLNQRGRDLRTQIEISEEAGNLADPVMVWDYTNEVTTVIALGRGEGANREVAVARDVRREQVSPYNRHELYLDCRHLEFGATAALQSEATQALADGRGKIVLTGRIAERPGFRYGYDYGFGDLVMVRHSGYAMPCMVNDVNLTIDSSGIETVDNRFVGEEWA